MKGSILDLVGIIFLLVGMVISGFLVSKVYFAIKNAYMQTNPTEVEKAMLGKGDVVANVMVSAITFITIGSGVGAIVLAFLIPSHPVFLPISIISLIIFVVMSTVFSNFLWQFVNAEQIVAIANQYPIVVSIIQYLPYIIAVFGFLLIIVMYSKSGGYE